MADLKDQVEANRTFLIDNIIWDDIRHYMRQELFSRRDDENIQACRINREKIGMCLELLPFRQHPDGYKVFMSSLTECYPHVRQKIECTEIANKKLGIFIYISISYTFLPHIPVYLCQCYFSHKTTHTYTTYMHKHLI